MDKVSNFLNKLEIWFFYGLLVAFTLSIRKVLFFYPIRGEFNEYSGIYLYLSDIFVFLLVVSWALSILYNKIVLKSRDRISIIPYLKQKVILFPLLLIILSFASVNWSDNWQIATFRSIKLFEFYLLYLWVIFRMFHPDTNVSSQYKCSIPVQMFHPGTNVPRGTFYGTGVEHSTGQAWNIFKNSILIIIITGLVQSVIGIWQFIIQKSIGLVWFRESVIAPDISGVAKIVLNGEKYIRAYGLFPHPNILGGFLVLSIVLTFAFFKPFNFFLNLKEVQKKTGNEELFHVEQFMKQMRNSLLFYLILAVQLLALILTFSKSAWVGLMIALIFLWLKNVPPQYKCSTWNILRGRRGTIHDGDMEDIKEQVRNISWNKCKTAYGAIKRYFKHFALIAGIILLLVVVIKPDWYSLFGKSIEDRIFYLNVSRETFLENPFAGVGSGQFVLNLDKVSGIKDWQFQPVHNVFLLILNELGIIGLILFAWFIWEAVKSAQSTHQWSVLAEMFHVKHCAGRAWNIVRNGCKTILDGNYFKAIFFGFLSILFFDHYFWDIQQGQIILWFVFGMIIGGKMWTSNKIGTYPQDKA